MKMKKMAALFLAAALALGTQGVMASEDADMVKAQKLDASYTLALNAINSEDYDTASKYLNICFAYCDRETDPTMYADLLLKQACIDVIQGDNDMALFALDACLSVQPEMAEAYLIRTQIYTSAGDFDQAIVNLEKYIELSGDDALYETVAQLHEANGDMALAEEAYDKFVGVAGENAEAGYQAGIYRMENGKYAEAIQAFEAYTDDEVLGAGALYNIGICSMNMGDYAGAVEAFSACEEKGGSFSGLYYNRGVCALMSSSWETAVADFEKSIETEPFAADARYNMGICQMQLDKYEEAIATFDAIIGEGEEENTAAYASAGVYFYKALCEAAIGNLEDALADYTVCIDNGYDLAQSYYQRAQVYGAMGDTENQNSDLQNSLKNAN